MCRLFAFTNASKLSDKKLEMLTNIIPEKMTSERDGFGVMIQHSDLSIFSRKFLSPKNASLFFKDAPKFAREKSETLGHYKVGDKKRSVVFHGRTSTNDVSIINTHPIIKHGVHLMHNGVVEDSGPAFKRLTTNDTENLLERIVDDSFEKTISGYYAAIFYKDNSPNLSIIKDSTASLCFTYSDEIESYVFATTQHLLVDVLKAVKITYGMIYELEDNIYLEFNGNEVVSERKIKPKGRSSYADSKASLSLGDSVPNIDDYRQDIEDYEYMADAFLSEVEECADHTWTFFSGKKSYTLNEFLKLSETKKLKCEVVRADGTILSMDQNLNNKLYGNF